MIIKLALIAEMEVDSFQEAQDKLDAFREAVLPSENYGIILYQRDIEQ